MRHQRTQDVVEDDGHDHDRGLSFDVSTLLTRRRALQLLAVGGRATLVGCGSSGAGPSSATGSASTSGGSTRAAADVATEIPEETAGPFPADGSNGVDVLSESGIVRGDITSSFGTASGTAAGVPLSIELTILDVSRGGAPVEGAAVYLWHCDREGRYSLYDPRIAGENHLRGVQASGADGRLSFTSIWPGAYAGRWPHIHFEVYPSLDAATSAGSKLVTSQIALPEDACALVYAGEGYEQSATNLGATSLATDTVFADGHSTQLAVAGGSIEGGMTATLAVGV